MTVKFSFDIPSNCWSNCKSFREILFCHTLWIKNKTPYSCW